MNALIYVREALGALTTEGWSSATGEPGSWEREPAIRCTIADQLDSINRTMGPPEKRPFTGLIESIRQAVIALSAAEQALQQGGREA